MRKVLRIIVFTSLVFTSVGASSQEYRLPKDTLKHIAGQETELSEFRQHFLQCFIDSLNNYTEGEDLPRFLFNEKFDFSYYPYWDGNRPISLRYLIFSKVYNEEVLFIIINSDCCDDVFIHSKVDVPFMYYSNKQLADLRLQELRNYL